MSSRLRRPGTLARPPEGESRLIHWVCYYTDEMRRAGAAAPVIAESFTEFLGRALDAGGKYYWLGTSFRPYREVRLRRSPVA